jgi:thiol-disulfide isomerase/thioredoxin
VLPAAEFEAYVASGFCIVDCFTDWCGPCKLIAPKYYELAAQTHAAGAPLRFAKFDCQSDTRRSSALAIKALPSFLAFHNGVEVGRMTGSKRDELEKFVATHAAAAAAAVSVVAA